jgi:hypothetical protein
MSRRARNEFHMANSKPFYPSHQLELRTRFGLEEIFSKLQSDDGYDVPTRNGANKT